MVLDSPIVIFKNATLLSSLIIFSDAVFIAFFALGQSPGLISLGMHGNDFYLNAPVLQLGKQVGRGGLVQ